VRWWRVFVEGAEDAEVKSCVMNYERACVGSSVFGKRGRGGCFWKVKKSRGEVSCEDRACADSTA
jgi:hypothetical protein